MSGSPSSAGVSTALLTDRYELTMAAAALADGTAQRAALPPPRVRDVGRDPGHGAGEGGRFERRPRRAAEDTA